MLSLEKDIRKLFKIAATDAIFIFLKVEHKQLVNLSKPISTQDSN